MNLSGTCYSHVIRTNYSDFASRLPIRTVKKNIQRSDLDSLRASEFTLLTLTFSLSRFSQGSVLVFRAIDAIRLIFVVGTFRANFIYLLTLLKTCTYYTIILKLACYLFWIPNISLFPKVFKRHCIHGAHFYSQRETRYMNGRVGSSMSQFLHTVYLL